MRYFRNIVTEDEKASAATKIETVALVKRATGGDYEAFGELYSIYLERIYRYIFYQVRDKMTAEDLTEEVFVKAWKSIGSCRGKEQTFSAWLYRIAHNHLIDNIRRQRRYVTTDIEALAVNGDLAVEEEGRLERQEMLDVITGLPENQKQVILLKFIEGLDNQEIGQVMGKSQGAIRVLQMRGLATLRQRLNTEI